MATTTALLDSSAQISLPTPKRMRKLSRARRKEIYANSPLSHAINTLCVPTFDKVAVRKFMDAKLEKAKNPPSTVRTRWESKIFPAFFFFWVTCAMGQYTLTKFSWSAALVTLCFLLLFLGMLFWKKEREIIRHYRPQAHWKIYDPENELNRIWLARDGVHVPFREMEKVRRIKERRSDACFLIHALDNDPVLEVLESGESFYIGVWDEEEFVL